ncbi:MAG: hypothetical protein JSS02_03865, partial [Planctomycetes bacterium]|nr:hypothetical protein [Planctomycetota bacterium]
WNRSGVILWAAGLLLLALGRPSRADEAITSDRRLPKNTVVYLSARNVNELKADWPKSLFAQMFADESLAAFRDQIAKKFDEFSEEVRENLGMNVADLWAVPQGEVAFAGLMMPDSTVNAALLIDFGDQEEAVHKLLEKHAEHSQQNDSTRREEEFEDTKIVFYEKSAEGEDDTNAKKLVETDAYFIKDRCLVLAENPATLKEILKRWDGKQENTFAENETYQYIVEKCREEGTDGRPDVVWYLDPVTILKAVAAENADKLGQAGAAVNLLPMLGIDNFKGLGGVVDFVKGDYDIVARTLVMVEQTPQGLNNLFQFELTAQAPPKWLSSEWTAYSSYNWNAAKTYSAIEGLADMFLGPGGLATQLQKIAENPATGGIHLKKDVFDQLSGTIHIAERESGDGDKSPEGTLIAVQIKKAAAIRSLMTKIVNLGVVKFNEREFQGETLYEFNPLALAGIAEDEEVPNWGIAVSDGHLMIATDVRLLERVLRGVGDGETLADSAAYKRVARRFPAKTAYISFSRPDVSMKSLFEMLKTGAEQVSDTLGDFDFSVLPDAEVLKKYLPPAGGYMEKDTRGYKITHFSLRGESSP